MFNRFLLLPFACLLGACAQSSTIPLSLDTIQITSTAAPVCGAVGAQKVALKQAAIETINRGYDKFIIVGGGYQNDVRVIGHTPVVANTTGSATAHRYGNTATAYGQSRTTYSGGAPIVGGTHNQGLVVKMFKDGDPKGSQAVPARTTLGPKWAEMVQSKSATCLD